jgi:hypothetical protein
MQPAHLDLEKASASDGNNVVTRLNGKLSLETVHNFIQTLRPEPAAHLVLDMSGVSFSGFRWSGSFSVVVRAPAEPWEVVRRRWTDPAGDGGAAGCRANQIASELSNGRSGARSKELVQSRAERKRKPILDLLVRLRSAAPASRNPPSNFQASRRMRTSSAAACGRRAPRRETR